MQDLVNAKTGFIMAVVRAKNVANETGETQMIYAYNENAGDYEGHHIVIPKFIDDCFKDDDKLDLVKKVVP